MLQLKGIRKNYKQGKSRIVQALCGVDAVFPEKGMVFITGKSGSGKSTLLNILGMLDGFDGGDFIVDGRSVKNFSAAEADLYRNHYVGFVFQEYNLLENDTVRNNVALALDLQGERRCDEKVCSALREVELEDMQSCKPNELSGGQRQRVAIARAIVKQPKLLLCDEPTGSLDSRTGASIFALLKKISQNSLVVVVSHDRESAEEFADRIIELKDGQKISDTDAEFSAVTQEELKFPKKKSLSAVKVFRMGGGYLKQRPIRLAIVLIISLLTFVMLGVSDSVASYDRMTASLESTYNYGNEYFSVSKFVGKREEEQKDREGFYDEDIDYLKQLLGATRFDRAYNYRISLPNVFDPFSEIPEGSSWRNSNVGFLEADQAFFDEYGLKLVAGRLPANDRETVISKLVYETYCALGYRDFSLEDKVNIENYDDILGKTLYAQISALNSLRVDLEVVGIVDTAFDYGRYGDFLSGGGNDPEGFVFEVSRAEYFTEVDEGMHRYFFVNPGFSERVLMPVKQTVECGKIFVSVTGNRSRDKKVIGLSDREMDFFGDPGRYEYEEIPEVTIYKATNNVIAAIEVLDDEVLTFAPLFRYVSLGFLLIAILFILYYFSGVVADKKQEVGILRAMGSSRANILKIFAAENGILALAIFALSSVFSLVLVSLINEIFMAKAGILVSLVYFSLRQFALVAGVTVGAVLLGVLIPAVRILAKKPVCLINGK